MEQQHFILKIVESVYSQPIFDDEYEGSLRETNTFLVSTRKIEEFKDINDFAYGYVGHLVDAALEQLKRGFKDPRLSTGEKYSFTDGGQDWYGFLAPDLDCQDEVVDVQITVNGKF